MCIGDQANGSVDECYNSVYLIASDDARLDVGRTRVVT
jgi:hypothetical protein